MYRKKKEDLKIYEKKSIDSENVKITSESCRENEHFTSRRCASILDTWNEIK